MNFKLSYRLHLCSGLFNRSYNDRAMPPAIRYATSSDGRSIAFCAAGEGPPLVHLPWLPWSNLEAEWRNSEMLAWYDRLSQVVRLIRFDPRGTGLSDKSEDDLSLDAQVKDLAAVVERLNLSKTALMAVLHTGPAAIRYAQLFPERVSGVILWCTYASGRDYYRSAEVQAIRSLIDNWDLYTETAAHAFVGWGQTAAMHELALMMRETATPETAASTPLCAMWTRPTRSKASRYRCWSFIPTSST